MPTTRDAPVQAYLAALPGWKRALGQRLDAVIVRAVPGVRKAVNHSGVGSGPEVAVTIAPRT